MSPWKSDHLSLNVIIPIEFMLWVSALQEKKGEINRKWSLCDSV